MRDIKRIKPLLKKLEKLWIENQDLRLCQLFLVIAKSSETNPKLFYMEDDEFLEKIKSLSNSISKIII
jgi:uncharacterized protein YihD (DUF1040 family)